MVELATVLIIVGLLLGMFITFSKVQRARQNIQITLDNLEAVRQGLLEYVANQHHYPLPAGLTQGPSSPIFGMSINPPATLNEGFCTGDGICRMTSGDGPDGVASHDYDKDHVKDLIVMGAVPFVTMQTAGLLPTTPGGDPPGPPKNQVTSTQIVDAWGNKIVYAVSETLTSAVTFNPAHGVIRVVDEHGQNILTPIDGAHFILLSYGPDGQGAYSINGQQPVPCSINRTESRNCFKPFNVGNTATFVSGLRSMTDNADYYDDIIKYQTWSMSALWSFSSVADSAYNLNPGNVGVNTRTPNNPLDINGKFQGRNVDAKNLCDAIGGNCYDPAIIGGTALNKCSGNNAMQALGPRAGSHNDVQAECAAITFTPVVNFTCPAGKYVAGVSNINGVICCAPGDINCP